jgi:twinkle protein
MNTNFVKYHVSCPECGSSDAVSINEDGSAKCFSCGVFMQDYSGKDVIGDYARKQVSSKIKDPVVYFSSQDYVGVWGELTDRKISAETAQKYGVRVVLSPDYKEVIKHYYPYHKNGELVGYKIRTVKTKGFVSEGDISQGTLFGQNVFKAGGKYVTITEGECDAMAAHELTGSKWPVVSIKNGAQSAVADVRKNLEYLESFDNVVICFDADKQGREAARKVAALLRPNKAKIMKLPEGFKDANDMLKENERAKFVECFWQAQTYTPSGIIRVSEMKEEWKNRKHKETIPYPWEGLNDKLYGMRQGELVTFTGGTGLGKSSVTRELEHWLIERTKDRVGVISLEEEWRRTVDGILSIEANARLYIDEIRATYDEEELDKLYDKVMNSDRVFIHAHHGINDIDEIFSKLRYIIIGCQCKWVVIDHLHMLVAAVSEGDERRSIDNIMTSLRSIVEETGIGLLLVSHLRRVSGNEGHENGVEVNLSHLRGSQSIAQLSDCVIALERNQQALDKVEANTTKLRVLKSRYTGDVGLATQLVYDRDTGRLSELATTQDDLEFDKELPF